MARVFGYGSLLQDRAVTPAALPGWRRTWGVAMDNAVDVPGYKHYEEDGGSRPALMVAFLDIEEAPGQEVNGFLFETDDLAALDRRERNYVRVEVETTAGRAWTYRGSPDGRARLARGVAEGRCVVPRHYLMRVLAGFRQLGPGELDRFEATTDGLPGPLRDLTLVPHPE
jgi:Gamma-glutamyl cyclotransferase, AIG2-like